MDRLGMSAFARRAHFNSYAGNTYTKSMSETDLIASVVERWSQRVPGHGESDLSRKVVVTLYGKSASRFFVPFVPLAPNLPVMSHVTRRREGEDYYVETYIDTLDAERLGIRPPAAMKVDVVCYHHEALSENNGERSTDCDWEIVAILGRLGGDGPEPMRPLTMARNYLELAGGTFTEYTARQFAEAIMYWSASKGVRIMRPSGADDLVLYFKQRIVNLLELHTQAKTLEELSTYRLEQFDQARGVGVKMIAEIQKTLIANGLPPLQGKWEKKWVYNPATGRCERCEDETK